MALGVLMETGSATAFRGQEPKGRVQARGRAALLRKLPPFPAPGQFPGLGEAQPGSTLQTWRRKVLLQHLPGYWEVKHENMDCE